MATVKYDQRCDLCGQPVEIKGFSLRLEDKELQFCCAGCKCIHQLLYTNNPTTEMTKTIQNNNEEK